MSKAVTADKELPFRRVGIHSQIQQTLQMIRHAPQCSPLRNTARLNALFGCCLESGHLRWPAMTPGWQTEARSPGIHRVPATPLSPAAWPTLLSASAQQRASDTSVPSQCQGLSGQRSLSGERLESFDKGAGSFRPVIHVFHSGCE